MDWTLYILMAMWATTVAFELRMIIKNVGRIKQNIVLSSVNNVGKI